VRTPDGTKLGVARGKLRDAGRDDGPEIDRKQIQQVQWWSTQQYRQWKGPKGWRRAGMEFFAQIIIVEEKPKRTSGKSILGK